MTGTPAQRAAGTTQLVTNALWQWTTSGGYGGTPESGSEWHANGPGAMDKHRKALPTQSISDDASVLETVHFNGVSALAIEAAKLRDQNLRPADL